MATELCRTATGMGRDETRLVMTFLDFRWSQSTAVLTPEESDLLAQLINPAEEPNVNPWQCHMLIKVETIHQMLANVTTSFLWCLRDANTAALLCIFALHGRATRIQGSYIGREVTVGHSQDPFRFPHSMDLITIHLYPSTCFYLSESGKRNFQYSDADILMLDLGSDHIVRCSFYNPHRIRGFLPQESPTLFSTVAFFVA